MTRIYKDISWLRERRQELNLSGIDVVPPTEEQKKATALLMDSAMGFNAPLSWRK